MEDIPGSPNCNKKISDLIILGSLYDDLLYGNKCVHRLERALGVMMGKPYGFIGLS
jgi:hypothetical protein